MLRKISCGFSLKRKIAKIETKLSHVGRFFLFARVIVATAFLSLLFACGNNEVLKVSTEADALEIIDVLSKYNIESYKTESGGDEQKVWTISVSSDVDLTLVSQILTDHSLPRPQETADSNSSIFVPTEQERKQKELRLKKRDVERQLRQLPGVTSADVMIVPSEDPYFKVEPVPAKANVVLRYKEVMPSEDHVKAMVASSVERLSANDVNVMLVSVPQRAIPPSKTSSGKLNPLLMAIGIGLIALIPFLLIVLILQNRRKQMLLAQMPNAIADGNDNVGLLPEAEAKSLDAKPSNLLKEGIEENVAAQNVSVNTKSV